MSALQHAAAAGVRLVASASWAFGAAAAAQAAALEREAGLTLELSALAAMADAPTATDACGGSTEPFGPVRTSMDGEGATSPGALPGVMPDRSMMKPARIGPAPPTALPAKEAAA